MHRRVVNAQTSKDLTTGNACLETPPAIFAQLDADFGPFDLDLTADPDRTLCPRWLGPYSTLDSSALHGGWRRFGSMGYSNPPYGKFIRRILPVAQLEAAQGFESVFLLPVRVTKAFIAVVELGRFADVWLCDRRITFWENGAPRRNPKTGKVDPAMFDSMLLHFCPHATGALKIWHVPDHVDATATERRAS